MHLTCHLDSTNCSQHYLRSWSNTRQTAVYLPKLETEGKHYNDVMYRWSALLENLLLVALFSADSPLMAMTRDRKIEVIESNFIC